MIAKNSQGTRRLLKIGFVFFLALIFGACVNDDLESITEEIESPYFWSPMVKIQKGNLKATLFLTDPRPFSNYIAPGPSNPEYFNIWISEDSENFSLFKKVDITTTSVNIGDLINGKPYFIYVTSHKGDELIESGPLMI